MNYDDTHPYALPRPWAGTPARPNWLDQTHADLDPYAVVDDHTTEVTAVIAPRASAYGARPQQVGLALARLIDLVQAHEELGQADDLDKYLARFVPGPASIVEWIVPANTGRIATWAAGGIPDGYEPGRNAFGSYPLANLGTHAEQHKEVCKAAGTLVRGGPS